MSNKYDVIVTGSEGFIGSRLVSYLQNKSYEVGRFDLALGHNLCDSKVVNQIFSSSSCPRLVTMHGTNHHIDAKNAKNGWAQDVTPEEFSEVLVNNVTTTYSICKAFMSTRSNGKIINTSSIYSLVSPNPTLYLPNEKNIAYGVSKAAINQLTRHLAVHGAPNFSANTIILGGIERNHDKNFIDKYSAGVPMGRMGSIEDVLPLIETLLFRQSPYLTGAEITLDGGYTCL